MRIANSTASNISFRVLGVYYAISANSFIDVDDNLYDEFLPILNGNPALNIVFDTPLDGAILVANHESTYNHSQISHTNRAALDLVSGTNTGDQDLSGKEDVGVAATLVANLVNSAPSTLDTLKEISDALAADPNFSTTITTLIGTKETPAGAQSKANTAQSNAQAFASDPSNINQDATHRFATDAEKTTWNAKEDTSNKDTDVTLAANSDVKYPSQKAVKTFVQNGLSVPSGFPANVQITALNKSYIYSSKDGLVIHQSDSATQTNTAGAYNGGGTGQKAFIELTGYDTVALSTISSLSFNAKNYRDGGPVGQAGNLSWNILQNFNNGFLTAANDYAIIINDGLPALFTQFHILNSNYAAYTTLASARAFKCVGGTGVINFTGNTTLGSNEVTAVSGSNIAALTVGMYVRKIPTGPDAAGEANMPFPDGSIISSIDLANNKFTVEFNALPANAALTATATSFKQYGGIAPADRVATANGTTTLSGIITLDLQVNMKVTGAGIPANSYITSISVPSTGTAANGSIVLNNSVPASSPTISIFPTGKTGIPGNAENVGIPLTKIVSNNPNAFITNNAPLTPIWAANDGGAPKNFKIMGGIQLNQGSSGITTHRTNAIKSITINSDVYTFAL